MRIMTRTKKTAALSLAGALFFSACASQAHLSPESSAEQTEWTVKEIQHGKASWYGIRCNGGTATASGEKLSNDAATAAHKTLPMGTKVRVTNLNNGKTEVVRINDRGPFKPGRIIDVTEGVAHRLDFYKRGIVKVKVEVLEKNSES